MKKTTFKAKGKTIISDDLELEILKKSARKSSENAVKESRVLGLTIKIIENNNLVEKLPNGEIRFIKAIYRPTLEPKVTSEKVSKVNKNSHKLKKGTVLCRK